MGLGRFRHPTRSIEEHGIIGDLRTAALVDVRGTIDFLCWPRFDSPSVFARLLDPEGGAFSLAPEIEGPVRLKQIYMPGTNVLISRFLSDGAVIEVTDLMSVEDGGPQRIIRVARCVRGRARVAMRCAPRFDYARAGHSVDPGADGAVNARSVRFVPQGEDAPTLRLLSTVPLGVEVILPWFGALFHETGEGRPAPFPRCGYATGRVMGMPSAVKRLRMAMRV